MTNNQDLVWLEPKTPKEILDEAIEKYDLESLYVLYSGGKDSVCIVDYVAKNYPKLFKGAVFTVTGFGSNDTREFAVDYCKRKNWPLQFTWPREDERYYSFVMRFGFPGPGSHKHVMGFLKYHTWSRFMRPKLKNGEKAAFISGVRKKESWARSKARVYSKSPVDLDSKLIFIKPFLYKNATQLYEYYNEHELEKSPTYKWFDRSGECYCGSFAEEWELKMMEKNDKLAFDTIKWMERQIQLIGTKKAKKYSKWGHGSKTEDIMNQSIIEDYCGESCQVA
jgi:phosphoadenosine phosphosulfate reductase